MEQFKVGDRVRGLRGSPYSITGQGWLGKVTRVGVDDSGRTMVVQSIKNPGSQQHLYDYPGGFRVDPRYFVKTKCLKSSVKTESGN